MMFSLEQKLIALVVMLVAAIALAGGGYYYGNKHATTAAELAEAGRTATALAAQQKLSDKALADERALRKADGAAYAKFYKGFNDAKIITERVVTELRADVRRLRIPVRSRGPAPQDASGPATSGTSDEGHAELTADASEFVVRLLARGDEGIRKHGEVVDRYERLRLACTKDDSAPTEGEREKP